MDRAAIEADLQLFVFFCIHQIREKPENPRNGFFSDGGSMNTTTVSVIIIRINLQFESRDLLRMAEIVALNTVLL